MVCIGCLKTLQEINILRDSFLDAEELYFKEKRHEADMEAQNEGNIEVNNAEADRATFPVESDRQTASVSVAIKEEDVEVMEVETFVDAALEQNMEEASVEDATMEPLENTPNSEIISTNAEEPEKPHSKPQKGTIVVSESKQDAKGTRGVLTIKPPNRLTRKESVISHPRKRPKRIKTENIEVLVAVENLLSQPAQGSRRLKRHQQCGICLKLLCSTSSLKNHILTHSGRISPIPLNIFSFNFLLSDERNFKCRYCPATFKNPPGQRKHERSHEKKGEIWIQPAHYVAHSPHPL